MDVKNRYILALGSPKKKLNRSTLCLQNNAFILPFSGSFAFFFYLLRENKNIYMFFVLELSNVFCGNILVLRGGGAAPHPPVMRYVFIYASLILCDRPFKKFEWSFI